MFKAECSFSVGVSVTKARAIAVVCNFVVDEGYYTSEHQLEVEITEFDQRTYGSENADVYNIADEWVESTSTVSVDPEGVKRFAELHQQMENELAIAESEDDLRIDYGDDDITYVTKSENGGIVSIDEHWDQAKESMEQANEWNDGETYWVEEVEGDVVKNLKLESVE